MSRPRKLKPQNPATDKEVYKKELLRLQQSEVFHVVDYYNFTPSGLIDELWDPNIVRLLREILPYAESRWHAEDFTCGAFRFRLVMCAESGMATPRSGLIRTDSPKLLEFLTELGMIVRRWERTEELIERLFQKCTMAEVRYLLPQLQALVPPWHILRTVKPLPTSPVDIQMGDLRQAVQTIAKGLMSNPERPVTIRSAVGVSVFHNDNWETSPTYMVA